MSGRAYKVSFILCHSNYCKCLSLSVTREKKKENRLKSEVMNLRSQFEGGSVLPPASSYLCSSFQW